MEFRPLVQALKQHGGAGAIDTLMFIMFGDKTLADPAKAAMCAYWREQMMTLPKSIGDAAHHVVERRGVLDEIRNAKQPILAIAGAEDHAYTIENSENIARAAPHGHCVVVAGAGHSVALEAPDEVNRHLLHHFERASKAVQ